MDTTSTPQIHREPRAGTPWPGWRIGLVLLVGALTGALLIFGQGADDGVTAFAPATAVGIATLSYLAAAVTGIRWMAWAWVAVGTALVFLGRLADVPPWLLLAAAGGTLVVVGLVRRPAVTTPQALAMLGYFGLAVIALFLAPRIGLALAGLALAVHAVWDVVHYRRDVVVGRGLAVWCIGLDVVAGVGCIVLAVAG
ncbi:MAG TPA: hypothetical protein VF156_00845 [Agromyces sp.]